MSNNVVKDAVNVKSADYAAKLQARVAAKMAADGVAEDYTPSSPADADVSAMKVAPRKYPGTDPLPTMDELMGKDDGKAKKSEDSSKKKVKIQDSFGDEIEEEVDLNEIDKLVAEKYRAKMLDDEIKALRDETDSIKAQAKAEMDKARRYLELESRGRDALLEDALKADGGLEGFRKKIIEEYEEYSKLTDAEKEIFQSKREKAETARKMVELEKKYADALNKLGVKEQKLQDDTRIATLRNVYNAHKLPNPSNDEALNDINETIFRKAQAAVRTLEAEKITITEAILNREFKKAAATFKGKIQTQKVDPDKELREKLDAKVADAQKVMSSQQARGQAPTETDLLKRWMGMAQEGKLKSVALEALSDSKYAESYEKFIQIMQNNPKAFQRKSK